MIVEARLINHCTDDGLMEFRDDIPLGKVYLVDLSTRRILEGFNFVKGMCWQREMVEVVGGGWLPTELLTWPEKGPAPLYI
jgi:hypothetical protein